MTDKQIAEKLNISPQTIKFWKKKKPIQYKAVKRYLVMEDSNFIEKINLISSLVATINLKNKECANDLYFKDLTKEIDSILDIVKKGD